MFGAVPRDGAVEFRVWAPGHDTVEVKSARLLPDGKTIFIGLAEVKPVMQMAIKYDLEAADGTQVADEVALTINAVGGKKMVVSVPK